MAGMALAAAGAGSTIATGVTIASTLLSTLASYRASQADQASYKLQGQIATQRAEHEAKQLEIQADLDMAGAQQSARQVTRQKKLLLSALRARAAASGFGARDPSVTTIAERIDKEGTIEAQLRMGGGEVLATGRRHQAQVAGYNARAAVAGAQSGAQGARLAGYGAMMQNISSGLTRFAQRPSQSTGGYYFGTDKGTNYG